ncbi:MAG: hypothetical protein J6B01_10255 [Ruminococcus sp.]|nr:hypothetical protein [Ruminococcus sp.]MBO5342877.1 hypothetical protein [Ruminococcus sp.]
MKLYNKINRYGIIGILFMIGFIISSFVLVNTVDVASRITKENKANKAYSSKESFFLNYYGTEPLSTDNAILMMDDILKSLNELSCNVSFADVGVCVNNQIDDMFMEIVVNQKDDFILYLANEDEICSNSGTNRLYIGESLINSTIHQEGSILKVFDQQLGIGGILKNDNASNIDYRIIAFWDDCDNDFKQYLYDEMANRLCSGILRIELYSNSSIDNEINVLKLKMSELSLECEEYTPVYEGNDYQNYWYRFYNKIFISACVVFSIFTCFSLSYLWISSRKKEIATRKVHGYSNIQVFMLLISDIIKMSIPAIIISIFLELLYCIVFNDYGFFDIWFIVKLLVICAGMLVIGFLCAFNLIKKISAISPIVVIREGV